MTSNLSINTQTHRSESIIYVHDQTPSVTEESKEIELSQIKTKQPAQVVQSTVPCEEDRVKPQLSRRMRTMVGLTVGLLLISGFMIWKLTVEVAILEDRNSHQVTTREQLLNETTLSCGKLYQIGYRTDSGPVFTRDLTFDCPMNKCSCETYSDQWIMKQPLYRIYYQDTDPNNWSDHPSELGGNAIGLIIGLCAGGFFLMFTSMSLIFDYCCPRQRHSD